MNEKLTHKEAFEYYYSLGDTRSIEAVASEYKKSVKTIYKWSTSFKWKDRVKERDNVVGKHIADRNIEKVVEMQERFLNIIHLSLLNYEKNLATGQVNIVSPFEADKMMERAMKIMGEESSKTEININQPMSEEDQKTFKAMADMLKKSTEEEEEEENG